MKVGPVIRRQAVLTLHTFQMVLTLRSQEKKDQGLRKSRERLTNPWVYQFCQIKLNNKSLVPNLKSPLKSRKILIRRSRKSVLRIMSSRNSPKPASLYPNTWNRLRDPWKPQVKLLRLLWLQVRWKI